MRRKRGQFEIESWQEWTSIAKVEQGGTTIGLCGGEIPNSNIEPRGRRKWRMKRQIRWNNALQWRRNRKDEKEQKLEQLWPILKPQVAI